MQKPVTNRKNKRLSLSDKLTIAKFMEEQNIVQYVADGDSFKHEFNWRLNKAAAHVSAHLIECSPAHLESCMLAKVDCLKHKADLQVVHLTPKEDGTKIADLEATIKSLNIEANSYVKQIADYVKEVSNLKHRMDQGRKWMNYESKQGTLSLDK